MMRKYTVAVLQLDSQNDKASNMKQISELIDEAASKGAALVSLPMRRSSMVLSVRSRWKLAWT